MSPLEGWKAKVVQILLLCHLSEHLCLEDECSYVTQRGDTSLLGQLDCQGYLSHTLPQFTPQSPIYDKVVSKIHPLWSVNFILQFTRQEPESHWFTVALVAIELQDRSCLRKGVSFSRHSHIPLSKAWTRIPCFIVCMIYARSYAKNFICIISFNSYDSQKKV